MTIAARALFLFIAALTFISLARYMAATTVIDRITAPNLQNGKIEAAQRQRLDFAGVNAGVEGK